MAGRPATASLLFLLQAFKPRCRRSTFLPLRCPSFLPHRLLSQYTLSSEDPASLSCLCPSDSRPCLAPSPLGTSSRVKRPHPQGNNSSREQAPAAESRSFALLHQIASRLLPASPQTAPGACIPEELVHQHQATREPHSFHASRGPKTSHDVRSLKKYTNPQSP
jgi:hypothetical protein